MGAFQFSFPVSYFTFEGGIVSLLIDLVFFVCVFFPVFSWSLVTMVSGKDGIRKSGVTGRKSHGAEWNQASELASP